MAELADALDSGSNGRKAVQVQVLLPAPEKSTSSEVLFSMKRTLRCMKNEAGLRRTERYERFASRERSECFTETDRFPLHVCRRQTLHCWFCNYILLLCVKSLR